MPTNQQQMSRNSNILHSIYHLYADGFRQMTIGRTLWTIIIIKLVIIFAVLKLMFFPDFLKTNADEGEEPDFVATEMLGRGYGSNQAENSD